VVQGNPSTHDGARSLPIVAAMVVAPPRLRWTHGAGEFEVRREWSAACPRRAVAAQAMVVATEAKETILRIELDADEVGGRAHSIQEVLVATEAETVTVRTEVDAAAIVVNHWRCRTGTVMTAAMTAEAAHGVEATHPSTHLEVVAGRTTTKAAVDVVAATSSLRDVAGQWPGVMVVVVPP